MSDVDLPHLDESVTQLPSDIRRDLAETGKSNLYFFAKAILGYRDMTESCHLPMCVWLDHNPSRFKLVLYPRGHYKSSVATISRRLQGVMRNANSRALIVNETSGNATDFLRAIKQHTESNKVFRALYSDRIPKDTKKTIWNDEEVIFPREWMGPEPTIKAMGMTGALTSKHFTHITIDDPISEEATKSEKVMQDSITRIDKITSLMVKPELDTVDLIGTRWAFFDVYSKWMTNYGPKLARFIRAAVEDGEPIFPELISLETLAQARKDMGEYMFSCLYMNNPRNEELQDFNINDIRFFRFSADESHVVLYDDLGEILEVVPVSSLDITVTLDPAPAETAASDRNAITTVGVTPDGRAIVLDAWGKRCKPLEVINKLIEQHKRWHPRVTGIEGVAYQKVIKHFLADECERQGLYMNVKELKALGKKELRIRGLQPIAATKRLYLQATQHILRNELSEFPLGEHDDVLDSLSMHQQLWTGIMSPERWRKYRESERKLLSQINGYSVRDNSSSEDGDEEDYKQVEIHDYEVS